MPGGGDWQIERLKAPISAISVRIPSAEPESILLLPDQASVVSIKRSIGDLERAQYLVHYVRNEARGRTSEGIVWQPLYRGEGRLQLPGCEIGLILLDTNGDGVFDRSDFRGATSIGLDLDGDGRVWGPAEYRKGEEVIDVCGVPLRVIEIDSSAISFQTSSVMVPRVGQTVPNFSVLDSKGNLIRSEFFRGTAHVLDFWASWCGPCVEKLVSMEEIVRDRPKDVKVIGINVDTPERRSAAEKLIRDKGLSFPQVVRAQGEEDFLWRMFGSMQGVRLSVPLYVVIDRTGVIRYAGTGGEDLKDLQQTIDAVTNPAP
jgi:peroxiredoxin